MTYAAAAAATGRSGGQNYSWGVYYNAFRAAGLSPSQANNMASVWQLESGGSFYSGSYGGQPTENGGVLNSGGAYGPAQWNGARQAQLSQYAQAHGGDPSDPNTQAGFAVQELHQMGVNPDSVSDIVTRYENPRKDLQAGETRAAEKLSGGYADQGYSEPHAPKADAPAGKDSKQSQDPPEKPEPPLNDGKSDDREGYLDPSKPDSDFAPQKDAPSSGGSPSPAPTTPDNTGKFNPDSSAPQQEQTPSTDSFNPNPDSSTGMDNGMDVPSAIDGLAAAIAQAVNSQNKTSIQQALSAAASSKNMGQIATMLVGQGVSQLQASTMQQDKTVQDTASSVMSWGTNIFTRAALVLLGAIFVAVGLSMFKDAPDIVTAPGRALRSAPRAVRDTALEAA